MEHTTFNEGLLEKASTMGVRFSVEQMDKFYKYMNLLIEWNKKINLKLKTTGFNFFIKDLRL